MEITLAYAEEQQAMLSEQARRMHEASLRLEGAAAGWRDVIEALNAPEETEEAKPNSYANQ
ncbi:hypothetical protein CMI37_19475 [Candidatus Pacearchaeota archaeon]|nr:hypothetical protein [Candidatus Pacearchaeota archaeon]|tara:strand:- start:1450 stop:1632 length:183 start_codon:yes stop_codon:yes gene_type:complete